MAQFAESLSRKPIIKPIIKLIIDSILNPMVSENDD